MLFMLNFMGKGKEGVVILYVSMALRKTNASIAQTRKITTPKKEVSFAPLFNTLILLEL